MFKKVMENIISKRNEEIKNAYVTFALKSSVYVLAFICSLVWIAILNRHYVIPNISGTGLECGIGIAYGAFIVAVLFICYENIHINKYEMDDNIYSTIKNYSSKINYMQAMKTAYSIAYGIEEVDMNIELMSSEAISASDELSKEIFEDDIYVPEWEDEDDLLGIEVFK